MPFQSITIPLQVISDPITQKHGIHLYVLRTDLNHRDISGNKLFKLKYNLQEAIKYDKKTLLTFGGAFSNHIAATAAAGKEYGFETIGIIRGEEYAELNPTLKLASDHGMQLHYVSRTLYQNKKELSEYVARHFPEDQIYLIPEGGSNELGVLGCKEIINHIAIDFDHVCTACGTGATMAGIVLSLKNDQQAIGFQVLKAENYIKNEVEGWLGKLADNLETLTNKNNWQINEDYHFGGYAKVKPELNDFMKWFQKENKIPLDPIYTGKMMFGIYDLIKKKYFKKGKTIVAIHTGGLQGNAGFDFLAKGNKMERR